ncbi:MBL fold metallo-hydrolase [Desulfonema magnum]|uniref:Beta-lactamase domain-containing protein n=1 Tax=Desulfonema magnum TaxID=45655 RepID=A0A975BSF5_9BACT|nr:MBL fold metallo-hydrolase [Desulfonema magnum]QTA90587.1 Beta-lactamase domain-containing protein [Desulfonema magnum]
MKITILYDNEVWDKNLKPGWGFSCLVEAEGKILLFDTGADGHILLDNMKKLHIDPMTVDTVFISHYHWDHTGGLADFLRLNPARLYIPSSCLEPRNAKEVVRVKHLLEIHENIFSTGELMGIEQSLVVKQKQGVILIAGCSHPGVREMIKAASQVGEVRGIIGGLHGFDQFSLLENMEIVCATHCTLFKQEIKTYYPDTYVEGGAGRIIEI